MLVEILLLLYVAFATTAIAVTVTKSKIFKPFRDWLEEKQLTFIHGLFSCSYCFSHWVVFFFVILLQPNVFGVFWALELILAIFAIVTVSSIITGIVLRLLYAPLDEE